MAADRPIVEQRLEAAKWQIPVDSEAPVYETSADIPLSEPLFIFNGGHVKNQLGPYLEELVTEYGAVPFKVKQRHGKAHEVFVGISPEQLFEWTKNRIGRINEAGIVDSILFVALALLNVLPENKLQKKLQDYFDGKEDITAVRTILFGFRQQLGQYFRPEDRIVVIEQALETGSPDIAESQLDHLEKNLITFERQYTAGSIFLAELNDFLSEPENRRLFSTIESLRFELEVMRDMVQAVEEIVTKETIYRVQIEILRSKINLQSDQE